MATHLFRLGLPAATNFELAREMIEYSDKDGCVSFRVYAVTGASRSGLAGEREGALRVRLAAPPVNGAANRKLIEVLAKAFKVPKNAVTIKSGLASKSKVVVISSPNPDVLKQALGTGE